MTVLDTPAPTTGAAPLVCASQESARLLPYVPVEHRRGGMGVLEGFRIALGGIAANKMRSVLTALGIIIGIAAVIVMTSLGQGAAKATADSIAKMGTRRLFIRPADMITHGVSQGQGSSETLTLEHAQLLKKRAQFISDLAPEYHKSGARVVYRNQNSVTEVWGSTPNFFSIRSLSIEQGRNFTLAEIENKAMVAVLGYDVWNTLFLGAPAVGKTMRINGREFKVIGVQKQVGASPFGNRDDQVVIPLSTSMRRLYHSEKLSGMSAECVSVEKMHDAEEDVTGIMNEALKHGPEDPPAVRIFNQGDLIESANQQSALLTSLLAGIALVSLIVGGIGVMNIMLVSVTERTREIGIRRALGAKRKDVLYQFLIESVTLCLVGGVAGVLLGIGVSLWMGSPAESGGLGFPMLLSPEAMAISFASSAVVGIFFGIYPAMNASLLDPITALRHE